MLRTQAKKPQAKARLATKTKMKAKAKIASQAKRPLNNLCTYTDCLMGRAATPEDPAGKLLFQFLMVGGMVTFMATFNGWRHSGTDFFFTHHWIYPLVACVALFLRLTVANRVVDSLAPRLILNRFTGFKRTLGMTVLNVVVMAPIMTTLTTLLLYGPTNFWFNVADNLPISMVVSIVVNIFIVGPIVKMVYNNFITTERGIRWLAFAERTAMPWMYLFNS